MIFPFSQLLIVVILFITSKISIFSLESMEVVRFVLSKGNSDRKNDCHRSFVDTYFPKGLVKNLVFHNLLSLNFFSLCNPRTQDQFFTGYLRNYSKCGSGHCT